MTDHSTLVDVFSDACVMASHRYSSLSFPSASDPAASAEESSSSGSSGLVRSFVGAVGADDSLALPRPSASASPSAPMRASAPAPPPAPSAAAVAAAAEWRCATGADGRVFYWRRADRVSVWALPQDLPEGTRELIRGPRVRGAVASAGAEGGVGGGGGGAGGSDVAPTPAPAAPSTPSRREAAPGGSRVNIASSVALANADSVRSPARTCSYCGQRGAGEWLAFHVVACALRSPSAAASSPAALSTDIAHARHALLRPVGSPSAALASTVAVATPPRARASAGSNPSSSGAVCDFPDEKNDVLAGSAANDVAGGVSAAEQSASRSAALRELLKRERVTRRSAARSIARPPAPTSAVAANGGDDDAGDDDENMSAVAFDVFDEPFSVVSPAKSHTAVSNFVGIASTSVPSATARADARGEAAPEGSGDAHAAAAATAAAGAAAFALGASVTDADTSAALYAAYGYRYATKPTARALVEELDGEDGDGGGGDHRRSETGDGAVDGTGIDADVSAIGGDNDVYVGVDGDGGGDTRQRCTSCARAFAPAALAVHARVCATVFGAHRSPFPTRARRLRNTRAETYATLAVPPCACGRRFNIAEDARIHAIACVVARSAAKGFAAPPPATPAGTAALTVVKAPRSGAAGGVDVGGASGRSTSRLRTLAAAVAVGSGGGEYSASSSFVKAAALAHPTFRGADAPSESKSPTSAIVAPPALPTSQEDPPPAVAAVVTAVQARTPASLATLKKKIASRSQQQQHGGVGGAGAASAPPPPAPSSVLQASSTLTPSQDPLVNSPAAATAPVVDVAAVLATAPRAGSAALRAPDLTHFASAAETAFDSPAPTDPLSPSYFPPSAAPAASQVAQPAAFNDTEPPRSRLRQPAHAHTAPLQLPQQQQHSAAANREPSFISCASCHARVENAVALVAHLLQCPAWALDDDALTAEGGERGVERALFASPQSSNVPMTPAFLPAHKLAASMRSAVGASRAKSGTKGSAPVASALSPENPINNTRPVSRLRQRGAAAARVQ